MKRELSKNWELITVRPYLIRARMICENLERYGFETFILKYKPGNSSLRCYVYVRKYKRNSAGG